MTFGLIQHWTFGRSILVVAYALGIVGALFLQNGSYSFESLTFYDDANHTYSKALGARNKAREQRQRLAMRLILASFALQLLGLAFE